MSVNLQRFISLTKRLNKSSNLGCSICIDGLPSTGKTETCLKLQEALKEYGLNCKIYPGPKWAHLDTTMEVQVFEFLKSGLQNLQHILKNYYCSEDNEVLIIDGGFSPLLLYPGLLSDSNLVNWFLNFPVPVHPIFNITVQPNFNTHPNIHINTMRVLKYYEINTTRYYSEQDKKFAYYYRADGGSSMQSLVKMQNITSILQVIQQETKRFCLLEDRGEVLVQQLKKDRVFIQ